jgi:hypothetical protein
MTNSDPLIQSLKGKIQLRHLGAKLTTLKMFLLLAAMIPLNQMNKKVYLRHKAPALQVLKVVRWSFHQARTAIRQLSIIIITNITPTKIIPIINKITNNFRGNILTMEISLQ